jgi:hypothetical protein
LEERKIGVGVYVYETGRNDEPARIDCFRSGDVPFPGPADSFYLFAGDQDISLETGFPGPVDNTSAFYR